MPPFFFPVLMVAYALVHNIPEIIHKIRHTRALYKNAPWYKKTYHYAACGVTCTLLTVPPAYYGLSVHES